MAFPPQLPDLNPMEHLKREKVKHRPTIQDDLGQVVNGCWHNIEPATSKKLVESMPARIKAVLKAQGGHTKY